MTLFSRVTMHISMYSGYVLVPQKWECHPWHARSSHFAVTHRILLEAYFQISRGIFSYQTFLSPDCFQRISEQIVKMRPLCSCLATIPSFLLLFFWKDAQRFAQKNSILFMEVSAFTGMNVDDLFSKIGTFTLSVLIHQTSLFQALR